MDLVKNIEPDQIDMEALMFDIKKKAVSKSKL